ncbi:MAG: hypothetical protein HFH11_11155 [Dorea sp.]|nr:hypothetical protein [Dorea sp.]
MILKIKGADYRVKFGVGFVRELDKKYYTMNKSGTVKFGLGLETQVPILLSGDLVALSEFLFLGTCTEENRPVQKEVDDYIDQLGDVDSLFHEVLEELKASNATRIKVGELEKALKAEEEALKAKEETPKK